MKLLVIGSGGREHALAWKLAQSPRVATVFVAPGNAGTATETGCHNAPVPVTDLDGLLQLARDEGVALTVVGPEGPLVAGVVDRFRAAGLRVETDLRNEKVGYKVREHSVGKVPVIAVVGRNEAAEGQVAIRRLG